MAQMTNSQHLVQVPTVSALRTVFSFLGVTHAKVEFTSMIWLNSRPFRRSGSIWIRSMHRNLELTTRSCATLINFTSTVVVMRRIYFRTFTATRSARILGKLLKLKNLMILSLHLSYNKEASMVLSLNNYWSPKSALVTLPLSISNICTYLVDGTAKWLLMIFPSLI